MISVLAPFLFAAAVPTPALEAALARTPAGRPALVWVYFRDKGPAPDARLAEARALLTPRAQSRRERRLGPPASYDDLPVVRASVEAVIQGVVRLRHVSRWLNAVSVEATAEQVNALAALPFVERLDVVRRYRSAQNEPVTPVGTASAQSAGQAATPHAFDYGDSFGQLQQIHVPEVHELGLHGEGVVVAVFDAGFSNLAHEVFASTAILAHHDFVNGDEDVADGVDHGEGSHGTETLSTLGGFKEGRLIGPAFAASFLLAKTENTDSETPVEEDNWAAAAEWAEALGADVISSSLGYLDFDLGIPSYSYVDMNGATAISTLAAALAAERGVVVVNSAGNSGFDPTHNTLGAPADGVRVLSVGAVTSLGERTDFSSVGPTADGRIKPDVAAQGLGVTVASPSFVTAYGRAAGTSFSCPLTAGVVALVLQAHPTYTVDQVLSVMRATAGQAAAPDNLLGWGIVNALAAVQAPAPALAAMPVPTAP
jgi:subtilisin family serine protease